MDELDYYYECVKEFAKINLNKLDEVLYMLQTELQDDVMKIRKLVEIRKSLLVEEDARNLHAYSPFFEEVTSREDRITLLSIGRDIIKESRILRLFRNFEPYNKEQPIFTAEPSLFDYIRLRKGGTLDPELLQLHAIEYNPYPDIPDYRTCKYKNSFLLLDDHLDARIPFYLLEKYRRDQLYVRINPYFIGNTAPLFTVGEEALRPPDPYWIETLKLHNGTHTGCEYFLEEPLDDESLDAQDVEKYWEYMRGARRLQVIAKRTNNGDFSMTLEELSEERVGEGILIGRCIHLDSTDPIGTSFDQVKLNHLDLAINIYMGEAITKRASGSLTEGSTVENATVRTHLLRVDNIMFPDLLEIAQLFFISRILTSEWIENQFTFLGQKGSEQIEITE